jgi:protein-S-isoprenylcysteine O-methyltransferase Ste14
MSMHNEFVNSGSWLFRYRSFLPLLIVPLVLVGLDSFEYLGKDHATNELWQWVCFAVSLSGVAVRAITVGFVPAGTSGRNTKSQIADHLNTTGVYSLVRHPLYLGNYLMILGPMMFFHVWWLVAILTLVYALYYERIMFAEESFLRSRFGEQFDQWASRTPAFIPKLTGWRAPNLRFSWKSVLRREYSGVLLIALLFFLLDTAGDSLVEKRLTLDIIWVVVLASGAAIYVTLRTLKKSTALLNVEGR